MNNNISGDGTLYITVVNVFGSWVGDFVSPGYEKEPETLAHESTDYQAPMPPAPPQTLANNEAGIGGYFADNNSAANEDQNDPEADQENSNQAADNQEEIDDELVAIGVVSGKSTTQISGLTSLRELIAPQADALTGSYTSTQNDNNSSKTVQINLAWLVLFVPAIAILLLLRKRFLTI